MQKKFLMAGLALSIVMNLLAQQPPTPPTPTAPPIESVKEMPPIPPVPPLPPLPPVPPTPSSNIEKESRYTEAADYFIKNPSVRSLSIQNEQVIIMLKNGKTETYRLPDKNSIKAAEEK